MSRSFVSRKRRAAVLAPAVLVALVALAGSLPSAAGSGSSVRTSADAPVTHFTYTDGHDGRRAGDGNKGHEEYNTKA
ncbi:MULTISPECIES: hypothetical protein [Streptomyces]|uniref:Uncharacterized protein n=1 Tax=Streptomyces luteosporeus TaxID=173856 RepID=A0ABP6G5G2_9ACTN